MSSGLAAVVRTRGTAEPEEIKVVVGRASVLSSNGTSSFMEVYDQSPREQLLILAPRLFQLRIFGIHARSQSRARWTQNASCFLRKSTGERRISWFNGFVRATESGGCPRAFQFLPFSAWR